ncbi:hypothetical protein D3C86_1597960 [compost metagenome]
MLAHHQGQDHQHRVDLRVVAEDLGVEDVGLDQVDDADQQDHLDGHPPALGEGDQDGRDGRDDGPEDRHQAADARDQADGQGVFDVEDHQAERRQDPVDEADEELAPDGSGEALVHVTPQREHRIAVGGRHQVRDPLLHAGPVQEHEGREHEDQDEREDGREDPLHDRLPLPQDRRRLSPARVEQARDRLLDVLAGVDRHPVRIEGALDRIEHRHQGVGLEVTGKLR